MPKVDDIRDQLRKLMEDAIRDSLSNGNFKLRLSDVLNNVLAAGIFLQFYYREETNKVFIEFQYNEKFKHMYDTIPITAKIINYIHCNFKRNIEIWPEIILIEDGKNEICDSYINLTPFTIGYWNSLGGGYKFIADRAEVIQDSSSINFPSYPEDYLAKRDAIVRDTSNTYQQMLDKLYTLDEEYKINADARPEKSFNDFINTVSNIRSQFTQVNLSEEEKMNYINEYNQSFMQYKNTEEFNTKLKELNKKYGIKEELNSHIPEIFNLYNQEYYNFFGKTLPDINQYTYRYFLEVKGIG